MGKMNRDAYQRLINDDIAWLKRLAPPESLERQHIECVLRDSVVQHYGDVPDTLRTPECIAHGCAINVHAPGCSQFAAQCKPLPDVQDNT